MDERDSIRKAKLDLLRKEIRAGIESGPATVWNPDEVKEVCRKRT
ncbi:hypothetical protein [Prosthecochloris sp. SCSIO W1103]|nr:hypothetical protein [Prosthecochloris sp. SCSIO W1103]UZJ38601.1 hypothetical protein OO005_05250 [Prosthecochloris sp. SCSIO W1103]